MGRVEFRVGRFGVVKGSNRSATLIPPLKHPGFAVRFFRSPTLDSFVFVVGFKVARVTFWEIIRVGWDLLFVFTDVGFVSNTDFTLKSSSMIL